MELVKKERMQIVNILFLSTLMIFTSSCFLVKNNKNQDDQSDVWFNNCAGYTLNYTNKVKEERDSITIYGKVSFCSSSKVINKAEISFYGTNDSVKFSTKTDNNGYYEIKVVKGHYRRIQADCWEGGLTIPEVDLGEVGDAGGAMSIDMKLLRQYMLIQSIPLTRKDIRQIKKKPEAK